MPIHVHWDNPEKTVIHCEYEPKWTLEEFHAMIDESYKLMTSVNHTVHLISNFTKSRAVPSRMLSIGGHVEKANPPNTGLSIIVGAGSFVKALIEIASKTFLRDKNLYAVKTIDEAYAIIKQHQAQMA